MCTSRKRSYGVASRSNKAAVISSRETTRPADRINISNAASILATTDAALAQRLDAWREKQTNDVADTPE